MYKSFMIRTVGKVKLGMTYPGDGDPANGGPIPKIPLLLYGNFYESERNLMRKFHEDGRTKMTSVENGLGIYTREWKPMGI